MAAILKAPASLLAPPGPIATLSETPKRFAFSFKQKKRYSNPLSITSACSSTAFFRFPNKASWFSTLSPFAASGEATETDEIEETETQEKQDNEVNGETMENGGVDEEETVDSVIKALLESYKEALASADKSKLVEIEALFVSIEDEKNALAKKIAILSEELSSDRDRILRISADFDNFRKRTERERLSLVENVQGEVIEKLLPILDNFERAKSQIKVETEGEEKINTSYQSIYKQFLEILVSLGVMVVETIGNPFDPLLHEAIMREDSSEFEEGIIIQEFRKGFKLGDRLLRPSMVKVSAGPGPAKPEGSSPAITEESGETSKESIGEDEESV